MKNKLIFKSPTLPKKFALFVPFVLFSLVFSEIVFAQVLHYKSYRKIDSSYGRTSRGFTTFYGPIDTYYLYNGPDSSQITEQVNNLIYRYYLKPPTPRFYNYTTPQIPNLYKPPEYSVQPAPSFEEAPEIYY